MNQRPSNDIIWLKVAHAVAQRSLCSRAKVGSVLVSPSNRIVSTGYNGPPAGYPRLEGECVNWCARAMNNEPTRDYSNCPAVHSEVNCLLFAGREQFAGGTLYITLPSICIDCAKIVSNSGVKRIVIPKSNEPQPPHREYDKSIAFIESCGIIIEECEINS